MLFRISPTHFHLKEDPMARRDVVRAWKDPSYRARLSTEELSEFPSNPAGVVELTDDQLKEASGVAGIIVTTFKTCTEFTYRHFHCCH
jgi:mersacidin/lichenicidin family type 2 lantibiotic